MALTLEDRLDIIELCARFDLGIDTGEFEISVNTFAEDGTLEASYGSATGKANLMKFLDQLENSGFSKGKRHLSVNHVIEGEGDRATATNYLVVIEREKKPEIVATAIFHDTLRKINGTWQFVHRKLEIDPGYQLTETAQQQKHKLLPVSS